MHVRWYIFCDGTQYSPRPRSKRWFHLNILLKQIATALVRPRKRAKKCFSVQIDFQTLCYKVMSSLFYLSTLIRIVYKCTGVILVATSLYSLP